MLKHSSDIKTLLYLSLTTALLFVQWKIGFHWPLFILSLYLAFTVAVIAHNHNHVPMWKSSGSLLTPRGRTGFAPTDRCAENFSSAGFFGVLADQPIAMGSSASMVNGALEAFGRAAAIELPRGLRINVVSPTVFVESMEGYGPFFRGFEPVPVAKAALAFSRSIEGRQTGQVYKV